MASPGKIANLEGLRFGKLVVSGRHGSRRGRMYWICQCDCGGIIIRNTTDLLTRNITSCRCAWKSGPHRHTSGGKITLTYSSWKSMVARCTQPSAPGFDHYQKRGIGLCSRWHTGEGDSSGFQCFLADMGERPSRRHTIERDNNDLGYFSDNCSWATRRAQANNRMTNKYIDYRGERLTFAQAGRLAGLERWVIRDRLIKGWSIEKTMTTPCRHIGRPTREEA